MIPRSLLEVMARRLGKREPKELVDPMEVMEVTVVMEMMELMGVQRGN